MKTRWQRGRLGRVALASAALAASHLPTGTVPVQASPLRHPVFGAPTDFTGKPGARTVCVRMDRQEFGSTGCWNVFRLGRGGDTDFDYFVWSFQGSATGRDGHRTQRLKLRMVASEGESVGWQPGSEGEFDKAENLEVAIGFPADRKSTTFRVLPGQVHPYIGKHIYHVSWFDPTGKGVDCCREAQIGAITHWKTTEGAEMMPAELTLEVWFR